jgi:uncharacterized damage-inducible protein DinB
METLTAEQAGSLTGFLLGGIENEWRTTRKVILAIPAERASFRPDEKARSALELAWHIVASEVWFLEGVLAGEWREQAAMPAQVRTPHDIVAWYESSAPSLIEKIRALPSAALAETMDFFGLFRASRALFLHMNLLHAVHHRGQLSTYLRPMGAKVPSIYGPSGDEPMTAAGGEGAG